MPNPKHKIVLTDRTLKALKPPSGSRSAIYWDGIQPNFAVKISPKGRKSFIVVRRRVGATQPTWTTLGQYPTLSLGDARNAARLVLAQLAEGTDPREARAQKRRATEEEERRRKARTFAAVAELYIKRHVATLRSGVEVEAIIRREFVPVWGDRQLADITKRDVIEYLEGVVDRGGAKVAPGTRRAYGGDHAARKRLVLLRGLFSFCVDRDLIPASPCDSIKSAKLLGAAEPRDRVLEDHELRAVWQAAEAEGYPYGRLVQMLALTGARRDELGEARWGEVDLDRALLTVGADRMKAKAAHVVPLTPCAVEILDSLPRFAAGDCIFAGQSAAKPFRGFSWAKVRLDKRIAAATGAIRPYSLHDIRRTVRTRLSELGVLPFVAELILAHAQQGVAKVYDLHRYDAEKRAALVAWEKRLLSIVGAPDPGHRLEQPAVVVPLRARA
jgi:integrase